MELCSAIWVHPGNCRTLTCSCYLQLASSQYYTINTDMRQHLGTKRNNIERARGKEIVELSSVAQLAV